METIFLSDLHLGCPSTKLDLLKFFFNQIPKSTKIILIGDTFDFWRDKDFSEYVELFKYRNIDFIIGNHDHELINTKTLMGFERVSECIEFEENNLKFLATHGHFLDNKYGRLDSKNLKIMDYIIYTLTKLTRIKIRRYLYPLIKFHYKYFSNFFGKLSEYCNSKKIDVVFSGHCHIPFHGVVNDVEVFNFGSWYNNPHVLILKDGKYDFFEITESFDFNKELSFKHFRRHQNL